MFLLQLALWAVAGSPPLPAAANPTATAVVIRKRVEEVRVVLSARHGNKLVGDLVRNQLSVLDNGQPSATITSFHAESTLPLRVALVIDHSDSMQKGFAGEQRAARAFLERFLRPKIDSVLVVDFSIHASIAPLTSNTGQFTSPTIDRLEASGQTALYDAMITAAQAFETEAIDAVPSRRVMILLSDGEDNYSRSGLADALEALQRADVAVYALTAHNSHFEYRGDSVLREIADATGGRAFILKSYEGVDHVFADIESELRTQYSMTFRPPGARTCGYHTVRIVPRDSRIHIQARDGYYACSE